MPSSPMLRTELLVTTEFTVPRCRLMPSAHTSLTLEFDTVTPFVSLVNQKPTLACSIHRLVTVEPVPLPSTPVTPL
ncbi:hypothetical protein D3C73_1392650 [compost metagenome]